MVDLDISTTTLPIVVTKQTKQRNEQVSSNVAEKEQNFFKSLIKNLPSQTQYIKFQPTINTDKE